MTTNNLPAPSSQNTELALKKTKALFELTDRLLAKKPRELMIPEDDSWMYELWAWADKNEVPDLDWFDSEEQTIEGDNFESSWNNPDDDGYSPFAYTSVDIIPEGRYFYGLPRSKDELTSLTSLDLSSNNLTEMPAEFNKLFNLTKLDLGWNQFTVLPEFIGNLTNLTELYLWHNQLTVLPEFIGNLSNLKLLNLRDNQLTSLPESIGNLSNLKVLNLRDNQLTSLPKFIGKLTNLVIFSLSDEALFDEAKRLLPNCEIRLFNETNTYYQTSSPW